MKLEKYLVEGKILKAKLSLLIVHIYLKEEIELKHIVGNPELIFVVLE